MRQGMKKLYRGSASTVVTSVSVSLQLLRKFSVMILFLCCVCAASASAHGHRKRIIVASKTFTEAVILGDVLTELVRANGAPANHSHSLGDSPILWKALLAGEIDAYGDYTGTVIRDTLGISDGASQIDLAAALAPYGVGVSKSLGFSNTYIIGMLAARATDLGIRRISDLADHPHLKFGFGNDFVDRLDGWPLIRDRYHLPQEKISVMEHQITYRALGSGAIDATNLYSTDAEIEAYDILRIEDDLRVFPRYDAVYLYRLDSAKKFPALSKALSQLEGKVTEAKMVAMNAAVKLQKKTEIDVAQDFLASLGLVTPNGEQHSRLQEALDSVGEDTRRHLLLVFLPLVLNILVAIPLGIVSARYHRVGNLLLGVVGVAQTIPSLALLVCLIPLLGVGYPPALAALFIYGTLPIMKNTYEGLTGISPSGLSSWRRLWVVELPLASPMIIAGVKIAAILNVGTATIGAIIGAGGYGEPILEGVRHDDMAIILTGAIPAAAMAIGIQYVFGWFEKWFIPRGLRLKPVD